MWELVFHEDAVDSLRAERGMKLRRLRNVPEMLAEFPLTAPDGVCRGPNGRLHHVHHTPEFIVTYWVDTVVKEVRIIQITHNDR
jgi:hypothetical protein